LTVTITTWLEFKFIIVLCYFTIVSCYSICLSGIKFIIFILFWQVHTWIAKGKDVDTWITKRVTWITKRVTWITKKKVTWITKKVTWITKRVTWITKKVTWITKKGNLNNKKVTWITKRVTWITKRVTWITKRVIVDT
jgi:hypothetical protein